MFKKNSVYAALNRTLWLDLETYNEHPIANGTYVYASTAEITLFAYAIDDEPAQVWDCTESSLMPDDLADALSDPTFRIKAHNAMFDRSVLWAQGYKHLTLDRWYCTMSKALVHGFPGGLDKLCDIFQISADKAKDAEGKKLVLLFCKPGPKNRKIRRATRWTHLQEWIRFKEYARLDIEAMREIDKRIPNFNWTDTEIRLWQLDQKINDRGFLADVDLITTAIEAIKHEQAILKGKTQEQTFGWVNAATQRNKLLDFIAIEYGVDLQNMQASTIEQALNNSDISEGVKELLRLRLSTCTTSTAKYGKIDNMIGEGNRVRGTLVFSGASRTRRWSGRGFQPQNMSRPNMSVENIEFAIECIKAREVGMYFDVMRATSNAIRGCIIAPKGKKLVISDLSNIEGRGQAWLAGEEWKLQAFRDFDTKKGLDGKWYTGEQIQAAALAGDPIPLEYNKKGEAVGLGYDLYILAYAKAFGVRPEDVTKAMRQIGKVMELALGYEGGVGAFVTFALVYGIDLMDLARTAKIPDHVMDEAERTVKWLISKHKLRKGFDEDGRETLGGLPRPAYMVCECLKAMWRTAHPNIKQTWKALKEAATKAIENKGRVFPVGEHLKFKCDKDFLRLALPSGRYICYYKPRIEADGAISYMGQCSKTHQWRRIYTYGGKMFENATQSIARDFMADNMQDIEDDGYEIVLSVHDELITEAPDEGGYTHEHLSAKLAKQPAWARDIPLAAGGFEAHTYRKD